MFLHKFSVEFSKLKYQNKIFSIIFNYLLLIVFYFIVKQVKKRSASALRQNILIFKRRSMQKSLYILCKFSFFRYFNLKKAEMLLPSAMMLASVRVVCDWSIKIRILKSISWILKKTTSCYLEICFTMFPISL